MPITIKEIHVKTTIEKRPCKAELSKNDLAALKRNILRELADMKDTITNEKRKDR